MVGQQRGHNSVETAVVLNNLLLLYTKYALYWYISLLYGQGGRGGTTP